MNFQNKQTIKKFFCCKNIWWKSTKMLSKRASAGQGSNDDFKHLIQVNVRNLNLFECELCMKCFQSEQTSRNFVVAENIFRSYLFSSGSVGVSEGLWPISRDGICFASLGMISFKLTLNSILLFGSFLDLHGMGELLSRAAQIETQSHRLIDGCAWWITAGRNNRSRHQL